MNGIEAKGSESWFSRFVCCLREPCWGNLQGQINLQKSDVGLESLDEVRETVVSGTNDVKSWERVKNWRLGQDVEPWQRRRENVKLRNGRRRRDFWSAKKPVKFNGDRAVALFSCSKGVICQDFHFVSISIETFTSCWTPFQSLGFVILRECPRRRPTSRVCPPGTEDTNDRQTYWQDRSYRT